MERNREEVRREIEGTRASLSARLGELSGRVESAREKMRVRRRIEQRPWAAMGLSVLAGMLLFRLRRSWRDRHAPSFTREEASGLRHLAQSAVGYFDDATRTAGDDRARMTALERFEGDMGRMHARSRGRSVVDAVARVAVASITRALVSSIGKRLKHSRESAQGPDSAGTGDIGAPGGAGMPRPDYPEAVGTAIRGPSS